MTLDQVEASKYVLSVLHLSEMMGVLIYTSKRATTLARLTAMLLSVQLASDGCNSGVLVGADPAIRRQDL